jgi:hypothetical protein
VGNDRFDAREGFFIFAPRRVPHGYVVRAAPARHLGFVFPSGWEMFFHMTARPRDYRLLQPRLWFASLVVCATGADRSAWDRVVDPTGTPLLAGRAVVVVAGLLEAAAAAVGPRFGAVVRVRPAGLCDRLLQPAPPASGCDDLLLAYRSGRLRLRLDRWA